jgi:two-component system sensor histidine kinase KdpD
MSENSASVERFLDLLKHSKRGKFKVYIGMAAGVGKSYRMLEEAHQLLKNNVNVWIGFIETHKRAETEALVAGLPIVPLKEIFYKGHSMCEMDVESIIQHQPEVVIIDELPHTNVPGSKNEKRWEDVEQILNAGISVISAVNIQHIESINAEVQKITGIEVRERVPDRILRMADEVVNIDLTGDDLIQRLREGKIYSADKIQIALSNFFKKDNLLQLRELALKEVAHQVERKVDTEVSSEMKLSDNILGCISANHHIAKKIIRKTARLAGRFNAQWFILFVENSESSLSTIDLATQRHIINNFQLVVELGGDLHRIKGTDVAEEISNFAKANNVSVIVCGRSHASWYKRMIGYGIITQLQRLLNNSNIDLLIVT